MDSIINSWTEKKREKAAKNLQRDFQSSALDLNKPKNKTITNTAIMIKTLRGIRK